MDKNLLAKILKYAHSVDAYFLKRGHAPISYDMGLFAPEYLYEPKPVLIQGRYNLMHLQDTYLTEPVLLTRSYMYKEVEYFDESGNVVLEPLPVIKTRALISYQVLPPTSEVNGSVYTYTMKISDLIFTYPDTKDVIVRRLADV